MNPWMQVLLVWLLAAVAMSLGWLWQRARKNAGIVDVVWAAGVGTSAVLIAITGSGAPEIRTSLGVLGMLWGGRLGWHLWRRVRDESEDGRYRYLRDHWSGSQLKFFAFFQFQALLIALFALPFLAVAANPRVSVAWLAIAGGIWLLSVIGESAADRQLARFRGDPANHGKTCREGFWRYSRHPNYFFEWLHWFAYVCLAIGSPIAWLAWAGPVVMYVFLRWISGVPYTEKQALRSRGEDYRRYQRTTAVIIPWFPKKDAS